MRRTLLSVAVLASVFGGVGQASAHLMGFNFGHEDGENQYHSIQLLNSDCTSHSFTFTDPNTDLPINWHPENRCEAIDFEWNQLENFDLNLDDFICPNHHSIHPSVDPSVTPTVTPSVNPALAVPLPAGAWTGLIGFAAFGLATAARRKVATA